MKRAFTTQIHESQKSVWRVRTLLLRMLTGVASSQMSFGQNCGDQNASDTLTPTDWLVVVSQTSATRTEPEIVP